MGHYLVDDAGRVVYAFRAGGRIRAPEAKLFDLIIDPAVGGASP